MPIDLQDGGLVLLDVLGYPPIVVLFKIADRDALGTTSNGEFVLIGRPLYVSGGSVDTKDDQSWFPDSILEGPDIGISILRARDNSVGFGSPINASNDLVVLSQLVFQGVTVSLFGIDGSFVGSKS